MNNDDRESMTNTDDNETGTTHRPDHPVYASHNSYDAENSKSVDRNLQRSNYSMQRNLENKESKSGAQDTRIKSDDLKGSMPNPCKVDQVQNLSERKAAEKQCREKLNKTEKKTKKTREARSELRRDGKYSHRLPSEEKGSVPAPSKKPLVTVTEKAAAKGEKPCSLTRKISCKIQKKTKEVPSKSFIKAKELVKNIPRFGKEKERDDKRISSRPTSGDSKKTFMVDGKRENPPSVVHPRKDQDRHFVKERRQDSVTNKEKNPDGTCPANKSRSKAKRTNVDPDVDQSKHQKEKHTDTVQNRESSGSARTRLYSTKKHPKTKDYIPREDIIHKKQIANVSNESIDTTPQREIQEIPDTAGNRKNSSIQHDYDLAITTPSKRNAEDHYVNIVSLFHGNLASLDSNSDCNQSLEFGESYGKVKDAKSKNDSDVASGNMRMSNSVPNDDTHASDLSTKQYVSSVKLDTMSADNKMIHQSYRKVSSRNLADMFEKSNSASKKGTNDVLRQSVIDDEPEVSKDVTTPDSQTTTHEGHSRQHYCEESNHTQGMLRNADSSKRAYEDKKLVDDDAKYNLIKSLIQPTTNEISNFKRADDNIRKCISNKHRSENVLACLNDDIENRLRSSSDNHDLNEDNTSPEASRRVKLSQHSNIVLECSKNNISSEHISINPKAKSCKYNKKYRHFKHDEKPMSNTMIRYIKKIVSNENKKANQERDELRIIIDENSPKTSRIRIVNDRSSVSVVCHSLARTTSPAVEKNIVVANKAESSGGESSGYKSLQTNSQTKNTGSLRLVETDKNIDAEQAEPERNSSYNNASHIDDSIFYIHRQDGNYNYEVPHPLYPNPGRCAPVPSALYLEYLQAGFNPNQTTRHLDDIIHDCKQNNPTSFEFVDEKQNEKAKYASYNTDKYLSQFNNYMDTYVPCKIAAYQVDDYKKKKSLRFGGNEPAHEVKKEKEVDVPIEEGDAPVEAKEEPVEESVIAIQSSIIHNVHSESEEIIVLKQPEDEKFQSEEFFIENRFPNAYEAKTADSIAPKVRSQLNFTTHRFHTDAIKSDGNELTEKEVEEVSKSAKTEKIKLPHDERQYEASTPRPHIYVPAIRKGQPGDTCKDVCQQKRSKKRKEKDYYGNTVHELWTNKKTTVDSTDNESQSSKKLKSDTCSDKCRTSNKLSFNIFKKFRTRTKTPNNVITRLPRPPEAFLKKSVASESTEFDYDTDTDNTDSDRDGNVPKFISSKPSSRGTHSITSDVGSDHPGISVGPSVPDLEEVSMATTPVDYATNPALPPPASALPQPLPFCCAWDRNMMQYWQNFQQPPPASTVPQPGWTSTVDPENDEAPSAKMVPAPWFKPGGHQSTPPRSSNLIPPPEWLVMARGYAPCLPCSKLMGNDESKIGFSVSNQDYTRESGQILEYSKTDVRKKKVSCKLFRIFCRKRRTEEDVDEDERKVKFGGVRHSKLSEFDVRKPRQDNVDCGNVWESPDIAGIVSPEEIGRCFRRGFRADGLTLSGEEYLGMKPPSETFEYRDDVFSFSEHDTPLDFLLALGFSVDEATAAIKDDDVRSRFKAALTEARIWVPTIATTQGTLLYLLAMKAKPKVMRYFLQLVESIVNKRITNAVKLDGYLKVLEKVEEGCVSFVTLFGKDTANNEEDIEVMEKQRRQIFYTIYKYAEREATAVGRTLNKASVDLLRSLALRYRAGIGPHLELLSCYIGEGLLTRDVQLEAAVIYLSRLESAEVHLDELESYCGLPPSERQRRLYDVQD